MRAKLDWKSLGLFFNSVLNLFTVIREVFSGMKVGIEIVPWLITDGKEFFIEEVLKPLGTKFLEATMAATEAATKAVNEGTNKYLCRIPGGQGLKMKATTGERFIAEAKNLFTGYGYIDSDFTSWKLNHPGQATKEALADVWGMVEDSTFTQFFQGFGKSLDELCWSQDQIIAFCEDHRPWLRTDGYATFFLFKENGEYFVALVGRGDGGLRARVHRLSHGGVWSAGHRFRVVTPQPSL